jgi:hypothetical protein
LNDIWYSEADNEFAYNLFSHKDWQAAPPSSATSQLCEKCATFDVTQLGFNTTDLLKDIIARSLRCDLCSLFAQAAEESGMTRDDTFTCQRSGSVLQIVPNGQTILSIYADPNHHVPPQCAQAGSPFLPEPGSPAQFSLMKEWLRVCQQTHNHGQSPPQSRAGLLGSSSSQVDLELPTRVVDVGSPGNSTLQLIESDAMTSEEYFALSHCWGQGPMFRNLKSNIESLRRNIDFESLPQNFRDAITVTRSFGARYLWIDSLCIIQDDEKDWENEAARMQQVFSNATCVLAASSASSSSEGFLLTSRQNRQFVTMSSPTGATLFVTKFIDNFHLDVEEAVLNQRGWVLQERALARRSIHFTSTQLYMECGRGVQCESLMKLTNEKAAFLGDSDFPNSIMPYYKGGRIVLFQDLFRMYSGLSFTRPSDRSIAISGLEKRLIAAFKTSGGYGIFELYLERSLLWTRADDTFLSPIDYPAARKVPSWSWMAYKGGISYLDAPFEKVDWTKDYTSPFQSTDSGHKSFWSASGNGSIPVLKSDGARKFVSDGTESDILDMIRFDTDGPAHTLDQLRCIVIGKDKPESTVDKPPHYVLVIKALSESNVYVRVGVATLPEVLISWNSTESVEVH